MSLLDDLERIVRAVVGDLRFERTWSSTIERDNGDGTADVLPDSPLMRGLGLQRVPLPTIDPTTEIAPAQGCRCLLGFLEGDPRQPVIVAWEFAAGSATVRLDGGTAGLARKGDLVDVMLSSQSPVQGIVNGSYTIPGSPPTVVPIVNGQFSGYATIAQTVRARIIGGAQRVKA